MSGCVVIYVLKSQANPISCRQLQLNFLSIFCVLKQLNQDKVYIIPFHFSPLCHCDWTNQLLSLVKLSKVAQRQDTYLKTEKQKSTDVITQI